jgi:glutamyl-tRNA synthetase
VTDALYGLVTREVDDFVLRRGDGTYAYNLAVVVDDGDQGVDQVVRGDDLLASAPRQAWLADQLGITPPTYAHVPLAVGPDGRRLAKRDGAVTMADLVALGVTPAEVLAKLAASLGLAEVDETVTLDSLLDRFDPATLPRDPWVVT